jgi:ABC-type nitrate/sulfonate/bicarbonate transport systems, periplasmic components
LCPAAEKSDSRPTIHIGVSRAPASLPVLYMIEYDVLGDLAELKSQLWSAPEQLLAMVQGRRHQFFTLPVTLAARLHNKGFDIRLTNVSGWGLAYLVTTDPAVRGWKDLSGKTVHVPPRSSPPDALFRYFLDLNGLRPDKDVFFVHAPNMEIAHLLGAGRITNAVLVEPQATAAEMMNVDAETALDFSREWRVEHGKNAALPSLGFGGMAAFVDANPELTRAIEAAYREGVEWVNANPGKAGALAEKYLGIKSDVVTTAVPRLGLRYRSATDAENDLTLLFQILFDFSPSLIGDAVPDATLYWQETR